MTDSYVYYPPKATGSRRTAFFPAWRLASRDDGAAVEDDDACDDAMSTHPAPPTSPTEPRPNLGEISSNRRPAGPASAAAGSDRDRGRGEIWQPGRIRDWDRGGEGGFALPLGPQIFLGLPRLRLPRLIFGACFVLCCLALVAGLCGVRPAFFFFLFRLLLLLQCCCCVVAVSRFGVGGKQKQLVVSSRRQLTHSSGMVLRCYICQVSQPMLKKKGNYF
jgi:hypothetical protein